MGEGDGLAPSLVLTMSSQDAGWPRRHHSRGHGPGQLHTAKGVMLLWVQRSQGSCMGQCGLRGGEELGEMEAHITPWRGVPFRVEDSERRAQGTEAGGGQRAEGGVADPHAMGLELWCHRAGGRSGQQGLSLR